MKRTFALPGGDQLLCTEQAAVFTFAGPRTVLSTGANGGGLRYDLTSAFNYCDCGRASICRPMEGNTLREHQITVAKRLGLDPDHTTGLDTAANMDNMVLASRRWGSCTITAAVSAGANVNALCAGDPATLDEQSGLPCPIPPAGTINIFVATDAALTPGALVELSMVVTETKAALLRDLCQGSCMSEALATGTGTDGMVLISALDGTPVLNAGKHFLFGELASQAVREAVQEALYRQTGQCPQFQHSVFKRLRRFGITEESLRKQCMAVIPEQAPSFSRSVNRLDQDSFLVTSVILYTHLIDQERAGCLSHCEARDWAGQLLELIQGHYLCTLPSHPELPLSRRMEQFLVDFFIANLSEQGRLYPETAVK